jgi:hypothetical protein
MSIASTLQCLYECFLWQRRNETACCQSLRYDDSVSWGNPFNIFELKREREIPTKSIAYSGAAVALEQVGVRRYVGTN